jgi:hypothetical protein
MYVFAYVFTVLKNTLEYWLMLFGEKIYEEGKEIRGEHKIIR